MGRYNNHTHSIIKGGNLNFNVTFEDWEIYVNPNHQSINQFASRIFSAKQPLRTTGGSMNSLGELCLLLIIFGGRAGTSCSIRAHMSHTLFNMYIPYFYLTYIYAICIYIGGLMGYMYIYKYIFKKLQ